MLERVVALLGVVFELVLGDHASGLPRNVECPVGAERVEHERLVTPPGHRCQRLRKVLLLVVREDDDGQSALTDFPAAQRLTTSTV